MPERKHCWQLDYLPKPRPCFINAGGTVCDTGGCTVDDEIQKEHLPVTPSNIHRLCDSHCRLSSVAFVDNDEFLQRMWDRGERHLLSMLE